MTACAKCGQEGCLCRLLDEPEAAATEAPKDRDRDFTEEELGKRVRTPRGEIEVCPECGLRGVHVRHPRWRRRPAVDQYIHAATVGSTGYTVLVSCSKTAETSKKAKRKRATREVRP